MFTDEPIAWITRKQRASPAAFCHIIYLSFLPFVMRRYQSGRASIVLSFVYSGAASDGCEDPREEAETIEPKYKKNSAPV